MQRSMYARLSVLKSHLTRPVIVHRCVVTQHRCLHPTRPLQAVKPFLLADIGEGITECQLIQWFVQPGARVEQFDKICEVQSDKAAVEITSPFDGVIKKLHYEPDDMAQTGSVLVDIDIPDEVEAEVETKLGDSTSNDHGVQPEQSSQDRSTQEPPSQHQQELRTFATPAVRHLVKELKLKIEDVQGTGKDGRVLKEDVHRHVKKRDHADTRSQPSTASKQDRHVPLTPVQSQMFKTMTRSLSIPHFLYTCSTDMSQVTTLRQRLNTVKITSFAFIIKAVSFAFNSHDILNASLDTTTDRPQLTYHAAHHFGIAVDTPSGLLVPVIRNVQNLSISDIAARLQDISARAHDNKLTPSDFAGATFTLSNIGSIGGGVVSPVISAPQVAILGVGRSRIVPAFDAAGNIYKKEELILSWSADHRVVDGAECARCAERVKALLEEPGLMLASMR